MVASDEWSMFLNIDLYFLELIMVVAWVDPAGFSSLTHGKHRPWNWWTAMWLSRGSGGESTTGRPGVSWGPCVAATHGNPTHGNPCSDWVLEPLQIDWCFGKWKLLTAITHDRNTDQPTFFWTFFKRFRFRRWTVTGCFNQVIIVLQDAIQSGSLAKLPWGPPCLALPGVHNQEPTLVCGMGFYRVWTLRSTIVYN